MKKIDFFLLILLLFPIVSFGQDVTSQKDEKSLANKNIISMKLGVDDPLLGISYERLLSQHITTEIQIGLLGASFGAKYYFSDIQNKKVNYYIGVIPGWGFPGGRKTYFPIGINLFTKNNFRFSFDAGPRIWHEENEENFMGFSLKFGKRF